MEEIKTLATPQEENIEEAQSADNTLTDEIIPQTEEEPKQEENKNNQEVNEDDIWNRNINEVEEELFNNTEVGSDEEEKKEIPQTEETEEENKELTTKEEKKGILVTKPLKYRGKEIWVDNEEQLIELAQKGLDYSFKMNKIKPYRKLIDELEAGSILQEDIKALIDAKNGNKSAIKYLLDKLGVDDEFMFEVDENKDDYKPQIESEDPVKEFYQELANREPDIAGKVLQIYNELPDDFKVEIYKPDLFPAFVGSIKTGEFEEVYPKAMVVKASNPALSWLQAYQLAMQGMRPKQQQEPTEAINKKQNTRRQLKKKKTIEDAYNEIWDDKVPLEEIERKIFR